MIEILNETIKCSTFPCFVLFVVSLVLLLCIKRKIALCFLLIFLFFIAWRSFFFISSSRYCASFLLLFALTEFYLLHYLGKYRFAAIVFPVGFFWVFNIADMLGSFRNVYYLDMNEDLQNLSRKKSAEIFVYQKDYNRICGSLNSTEKPSKMASVPDTFESFLRLYNTYEFWEKDGYYIYPSKKKANDSDSLSAMIRTTGANYHKVQQYVANKHKTKQYSIYKLDRFIPFYEKDPSLIKQYQLEEIINNGTVKSCSPLKDVYIFQVHDKLYWLIGKEIGNSTEIIYHLFTDKPELLPSKRIRYQFDNRGFKVTSKSRLKNRGKYMVFEQIIPKEYPVTSIRVGFNTDGEIVWFHPFQPDKFDP